MTRKLEGEVLEAVLAAYRLGGVDAADAVGEARGYTADDVFKAIFEDLGSSRFRLPVLPKFNFSFKLPVLPVLDLSGDEE